MRGNDTLVQAPREIRRTRKASVAEGKRELAQRLNVALPATAADSIAPRRAGQVDWARRCACDAVERARCLDALTSLCACTAVDEKRLLQKSMLWSMRKLWLVLWAI